MGHSFQHYLLQMTVFMTLQRLTINGKLFSVLQNQLDFLRNECTHAGTFLLTVLKTHRAVTSMPRYVLNRDFCETFHP